MFKSISPYELEENTFSKIEHQWMLISAGTQRKLNMMTANWGAFGILWYKPVIVCFVRPQRYTKRFIDRNEYLTFSFFDDNYRKVLEMCGEKSGRDCNKLSLSGLTPVFDEKAPYYQEAQMVIIGKKLYRQKFNSSSFIDKNIDVREYEAGDYHYMYICEITDVLVKD